MSEILSTCEDVYVTTLSSDAELKLARVCLVLRAGCGVAAEYLTRMSAEVTLSDIIRGAENRPRRPVLPEYRFNGAAIGREIRAIDAELARRAEQEAEYRRNHR